MFLFLKLWYWPIVTVDNPLFLCSGSRIIPLQFGFIPWSPSAVYTSSYQDLSTEFFDLVIPDRVTASEPCHDVHNLPNFFLPQLAVWTLKNMPLPQQSPLRWKRQDIIPCFCSPWSLGIPDHVVSSSCPWTPSAKPPSSLPRMPWITDRMPRLFFFR